MRNLEAIIQTSFKDVENFEALIRGELKYGDSSPVQSGEIDERNKKYIKLRYFEGTITKAEHDKYKYTGEMTEECRIYDQYIFSCKDMKKLFDESAELKEGEINKIIDLRLVLSEESVYKEKFDQLIFCIFCQKPESSERKKLRGIAGYIYTKYSWAREFIAEKFAGDSYEALPLAFRKDDKRNNAAYGIDESIEEIVEENDTGCVCGKNEVPEWLLKKFGEQKER